MATQTQVPAVRCVNLTKRYGDKVAVDGLNFEISRGQCFGLLGPNGAGKTTTVEMLEGLTVPDSGTAELFGLCWGKGKDTRIRQRLGVQLQETQLADKLTVREVLRLFRSFYPAGRTPDELLDLVNLSDAAEQRFHQLSGGQKQRTALACALAGAPDMLFLDEPTTGLDPRARKDLWQVVQQFQAEGGTVLLTTHYLEEAATLADHVAILDQGRFIAEGSPASLVDSLGIVQFVEFELAAEVQLDAAALCSLRCVQDLEVRGERVRVRIARELSALQSVLGELVRQAITPIGLSTHQATLDDVFIELTGHALSRDDRMSDATQGAGK